MASYSSQTVAQLKEVLKSRGLSTDGKKSDLVARLEEADSESAPAAQAAPATENPEETVDVAAKEEPEVEETTTEASVAAPEASESTVETADALSTEEQKPEQKQLTDEEKKAKAVEFLTAKLQRAQKFGDETSAKTYESDLKRLEKFGLNPSSDLAFELGFGVKDKNFINRRSGHSKRPNNGKKFKQRNN